MNRKEIVNLIKEKARLNRDLENLFYGVIEIRNIDDQQFIYVHYRQDGLGLTKYVGQYSKELFEIIDRNNIQAKYIKKQIKEIDRLLGKLEYNLPIKEDVIFAKDFAKSNLVEIIYRQAILEGIATNYADTETILQGGKIKVYKQKDIISIINLKHAYEFILNSNVLLSPSNFSLLCEINSTICEGITLNSGKIRDVPIEITGSSWRPKLPIESDIRQNIKNILNLSDDYVANALKLMIYICKAQPFLDGNKRSATLFANHYLLSKGKGMIVVPKDKIKGFKENLLEYYEHNNEEKMIEFLKDNCLVTTDDKKLESGTNNESQREI